jgi:hypothetical protein
MRVIQMQITRDYCIVKVKKVFKDEAAFKGENGLNIYLDTTYEPNKHTNNCGYVESIPLTLSRSPLIWDYHGIPSYHETPPMGYKSVDDIQREIRVGDKVYFNYNCILPDGHETLYNSDWMFTKREEENGKIVAYQYFRIKYSSIYAAVRYESINPACKPFQWWMEDQLKPITIVGQLLYELDEQSHYRKTVDMIGSWVFVEPDIETWDDISIPVQETLNGIGLVNPDGSKRMKPKEQWIVTKAAPAYRYLFGTVKFVGSPLRGLNKELSEGMYVMYRPKTDTPIEFEGIEYHRMLQSNITCYIPFKKAI